MASSSCGYGSAENGYAAAAEPLPPWSSFSPSSWEARGDPPDSAGGTGVLIKPGEGPESLERAGEAGAVPFGEDMGNVAGGERAHSSALYARKRAAQGTQAAQQAIDDSSDASLGLLFAL